MWKRIRILFTGSVHADDSHSPPCAEGEGNGGSAPRVGASSVVTTVATPEDGDEEGLLEIDLSADPMNETAAQLLQRAAALSRLASLDGLCDLRAVMSGRHALPSGSRPCIVDLSPSEATLMGERSVGVHDHGIPPSMAFTRPFFSRMKRRMPDVASFGLLQCVDASARREILVPGAAIMDLCLVAQDLVNELWPTLSVGGRLLVRKVACVLNRFRLSDIPAHKEALQVVLVEFDHRSHRPLAQAGRRSGRVARSLEELRLEPTHLDMRASLRGLAACAALTGPFRMDTPPPVLVEKVLSPSEM